MNKRRLLKLADLLEADAKNKKGIKFDLSLWGESDFDVETLRLKELGVNCNTTACAVGLACVSGAFERSGLTCTKTDLAVGRITPKFGRKTHWSAVTAFFGINSEEAEFLFTDEYYPAAAQTIGARGERMVAKRIRDFVAGKVAP